MPTAAPIRNATGFPPLAGFGSSLANAQSVSSRFVSGQSLPPPRLKSSPFYATRGEPLLNVEAGIKRSYFYFSVGKLAIHQSNVPGKKGYTQTSYTFTADLSFNLHPAQVAHIRAKPENRVYAFSVMVPQLEDGCAPPEIDQITWPETSIQLNGHQIIRVIVFLFLYKRSSLLTRGL